MRPLLSSAIVSALLGGCLGSEATSSSTSLGSDTDGGTGRPITEDAATLDTGSLTDTAGVVPRCRFDQPGLDTDGDGLQDVAEDSNLNCIVDEGETDPNDPDSDGDGLLDGQEDLNRNGYPDTDRGEFDPLVADTDGDGVLDGEESLASLCVDAVAGAALRSTTLMNDGRWLILPPDAQSVSGASGEDLWFRSGSMVAAYLGPDSGDDWRSSPLQALQSLLGPEAEIIASGAAWGYEDQFRLMVSGDWQRLQAELLEALGVEVIPDSGKAPEESGETPPVPGPPGGMTSGLVVEVHSISGATPPRVTLSMYPSGARPPEMDSLVHAARIAPDTEAVPGVWCADARLEAGFEPSLIVVGDMAGQSEDQLRSVVAVASGALDEAVDMESAWFIPADAHASSSINAWFDIEGGSELSEILDWLVDLDTLSSDQRLWYNGMAAAALFRSAHGADVPLTLLLIAGREDTEFRQSSFGGRDGNPDAAPLDDGPARQALEQYYAGELARLGVRLVTVAPAANFAEGCAVGLGSGDEDELPTRPPAELSFQSLSRALGGVWIDACTLPDTGWFASSIVGRTVSGTLNMPFEAPAAVLLNDSDLPIIVPPAVSGSTQFGVISSVRESLAVVGLVWD